MRGGNPQGPLQPGMERAYARFLAALGPLLKTRGLSLTVTS